jgi:exosortase
LRTLLWRYDERLALQNARFLQKICTRYLKIFGMSQTFSHRPGVSLLKARSRWIELLGLVAGSVVLWWHAIVTTFELALASDAHTHILLILPLSLALIYIQSRGQSLRFESGGWFASIPLAVGLLLRGLAAWNIWHLSSSLQLSLNIFALVIWWIGSVILCFGLENLRLQVFPLCFLFLLVPLPEHAVNWITDVLQHQSAAGTSVLFHCAGIPVKQDGVLLSIPGLNIEVASECSSVRSSLMLFVTTMILAQLFLRSWWAKTVLVAAALPLSVVKNAVRIFTIAILGTRVDPGYLTGRLHREGGVLFLVLGVVLTVILLWVLRRVEMAKLSFHS